MNRSDSGHDVRVLRGEGIRVTVEAERGGRISSILHLPSGREWLAQPEKTRSPSAYGSSFTAGDMAGWDEMLPTIQACAHPGPGSAAGVVLPDHGEVWALPWCVDAAGVQDLTLGVAGRALPYRLVRRLRIVEPTSLVIDYRLEVLGDEPLALLWACHPQWDCSPGTSIGLPGVTEMLDVTGGPPGMTVVWPSQGPARVELLPVGTGRKLVAPPDVHVAEVELRDPEGTWLRMHWDAADLPHLGLWLDNRCLSRRPVVVLEPSDGFFDSVELAASTGRVAITEPGLPRRWRLGIELG